MDYRFDGAPVPQISNLSVSVEILGGRREFPRRRSRPRNRKAETEDEGRERGRLQLRLPPLNPEGSGKSFDSSDFIDNVCLISLPRLRSRPKANIRKWLRRDEPPNSIVAAILTSLTLHPP
jgi:hypothetical protein